MLAKFLDYTEIKTKITSLFAFLMSVAYLFYQEITINWKLTALFFTSMFLFDLTTTAINNYIDSKTNHQILPFGRTKARWTIYFLLILSTGLGLVLVSMTDVVVLLGGGLCFLVGVMYTYGPIPISRQPWGEVLSGIFYGLLIPFLILYINQPEGTMLTVQWNMETIDLQLQVMPIITLLLLSVNPTCATANIMLANNICDLEKDIQVKRYTLPYYLGKRALALFAMIYYATYAATILMVAFNMLPVICLLSLLTIFPVQKNIKIFLREQTKESTFIISIKNFVIIMGTFTMAIFVGGLLN